MKNINLKYQIAAGVILIIGGTLALLSNYIKEKRDVVFSEMNLVLSFNSNDANAEESVSEVVEETEEVVKKENAKKENKKDTNKKYEDYLGIIDIPEINLYKGFYGKKSKLNNVKFNLYVLPESDYPNVKKGNLIIAGHSGNYNNSYFANLYKLEVDDKIKIHYKDKKYTYKIVNIYYEKKDGDVRIFRDREETTLTLITCTKDSKKLQTIYISELISVK